MNPCDPLRRLWQAAVVITEERERADEAEARENAMATAGFEVLHERDRERVRADRLQREVQEARKRTWPKSGEQRAA